MNTLQWFDRRQYFLFRVAVADDQAHQEDDDGQVKEMMGHGGDYPGCRVPAA